MKKIVKFRQSISLFRNYLLLEKDGGLHLNNLNSLYPRRHCANFGENCTDGSGEEDFSNFVNIFSLFLNYLPLEKGGALHLNKLESPSPKDAKVD